MICLPRTCLAAVLAALLGCAGGPDYEGGPTSEQPHGIVDAERDVTIWRVDGFDTYTRNSVRVAPGLRRIKVRIEFPIDNESAVPYEKREISLKVEPGHLYELARKEVDTEIDLGPPYELEIRDYAPR